MANTAPTKSGFFTSEFWLALLGPMLLAGVNEWLGTTLSPEMLQTGGWAMVVYIGGRALLKVAAMMGWKGG